MARPPICTQRLSLTDDGLVKYRFKRSWRDGRTHVLLSPLEFVEKLAALVPLPWFVSETFDGRLLKVVIINYFSDGIAVLRTAYEPDDFEVAFYDSKQR